MNNFEFIDDYLTNRLSGDDKIAFEKQLETDASLKSDVELQKVILESVKKARAAELKTMLQNVPVGAGGGFGQFSLLKMAAGVAGAGLLIAALNYYFNQSGDHGTTAMPTSLEDSIKKVNPADFEPLEETPVTLPTEPKKEEPTTKQIEKKVENQKDASVNITPASKPRVELVDPTQDMSDVDSRPRVSEQMAKSPVSLSHISVDIVPDNKKYTFHYQFSDGKLVLYGAFDKSLYEILEINGDTHSVFMYYKDQYFLLDEKQDKATALLPITDKALLSKLTQYRSR